MLRLHVQEPWFTEILEGRKTVEGRVGPPTKFAGQVGESAQIWTSGQELDVLVVRVTHYPTLDEYIQAEGWQKIAPHTGSNAAAASAYAAVTADTVAVFSPERVKELGGINALEFE